MTELLTAAQMRAIEQAAISSGEVTGLELMERAGRGVVEAVFEEWPELAKASHRAVVLCGPGNNGGDGFVVARLLEEWGWEVEVFLYGDPDKLPPDARVNYERWLQFGPFHLLRADDGAGELFAEAASHVRDLQRDPSCISPPPFVLIDALFGIGLSRPLTGLDDLVWHWDYLTNFRDLNDARVVAIDICSGRDADTGDIVYGEGMSGTGVLPADLCVTFHRKKTGHEGGPFSTLCGNVVLKDIGL
ncbi:MAG: NAD(P)H-hydrate epimerase [Rhodobacteraceae bacterium]|nr:NAD(P)H-hydrate epimerase [Paracoccaceae bacterium]